MTLYDALMLRGLPLSAYTPGKGDPETEGPYRTASGAPMYTYEAWKRGQMGQGPKVPYVTAAYTHPTSRATGQMFTRQVGNEQVPLGLTDRGPGKPGVPPTIDIAYENEAYGSNYPYQGQTGSGISPYIERPSELIPPPPQRSSLDVFGEFSQLMRQPSKPADFAAEMAYRHPTSSGSVSPGSPGMSSWEDYGKAVEGQEQQSKIGGAIAKGIGGIGQGMQQRAQQGFQEAQQLVRKRSAFQNYLDSLLRGEDPYAV